MKVKGDAMNLRRIFCVLELIILVFWVLCIKYVTKYIKFPFIWHTVRLCSLISVGVTGKSVKNQFFDFSQFCQKKISSKWSVKTFVSIVIFLVKMAPKNEKIKESIIEFYKLHGTKGHWYTYKQWQGCDLSRAI